jgi:hypothetical protein
MMKLTFHTCVVADNSIFIGCATSAPDGSSPQGYGRIFYSSIGSIFSSSSIFQCNFAKYYWSPNGSIPRSYNGVLAVDYRLKESFDFYLVDISCMERKKYGVIDMTTRCSDLTKRWLSHMCSAVIFHIFCPLVGLPLPLFMPRRSPCSFQRKLFKGKAFYFY